MSGMRISHDRKKDENVFSYLFDSECGATKKRRNSSGGAFRCVLILMYSRRQAGFDRFSVSVLLIFEEIPDEMIHFNTIHTEVIQWVM